METLLKMNKTVKKVFNIIIDVLIIMVLIISAFVLIISLSTTNGGKGVPNVFGKAPISVLSDSMKGDKDDCFNKGDLLICDVAKDGETYKTGDIITFRADLNGDGEEELLTHRIYQVNQDGSYYTKGDANAIYDQADTASPKLRSVYPSDVLAVYHGTKIGGLGNVLNFLRSSQGFFFCILLPMIIFFIYQAVRVIMNIIAYNKEKAMVAAQEAIQNSELTEEQKARAIAEYLEKEKAKAAEAADAADETDGESEGDEASDEADV